MKSFDEAKNLILNSQKIILTAHTNPDGDAIGSLYGLYLAIKKLGKEPIVVLEQYNPRFDIIMPPSVLYNEDINNLEVELFISLDCGDVDRINEEHLKLFKKAKKTINIDHHASNYGFGDVNIVDTDMCSASEVVFDLVNSLVEVDREIMSPIYAGIIYDSGGFKYSKVTSNTHKIAGIAHDLGIDFNTIFNEVLGNHTLTEIKMFTKALEKIEVDVENKIIYSFITREEMDKCNATKDNLGAVVSYLLNTEGFELAIFSYEKDENLNKVSLRSKKLDVNLLASYFGGGGHHLASGCVIEGNILEAVNKVLLKAKELIKDEKFI